MGFYRLGWRSPSAGLLAALLASYVAWLAAAPILHHDLACHLKSRTHCTSCTVGDTAASGLSPAGWLAADLRDAGPPQPLAGTVVVVGIAALRCGRAPPA